MPNHNRALTIVRESCKEGVYFYSSKEREDELKYKLHILKKKFFTDYGVTSPNSCKQLSFYIRNNLTSDILKYCIKNGELSLRKDVLSKVSDSDIVKDILEYRRVQSFLINNNLFGEVCFPIVSLGITNRIVYSKPNIILMDRNKIAPTNPNEYLVSVDIKNQEPLILIEMLGVSEMRPYISSPKGFYVSVFNNIYNKEPTEVEVREFKSLWLMYTYGNKNINSDIIDVSKIVKFFQYSGLDKALNKLKSLSYANSRSVVTYFGTKITRVRDKLKASEAINYSIQGTASDIMAILIENCANKINYSKYKGKISLYVYRYDELIFRVSEDVKLNEAMLFISDITKHSVDDWCEFNLEIKKL